MYVIFQGARDGALRAFNREYPSLTDHELFKGAYLILKTEGDDYVVGITNKVLKKSRFYLNYRII